MTKMSGSRSAVQFNTSDTDIPERPTTEITIGSGTYLARAPKIDVWREVVGMMTQVDYARELAEAADTATPDELDTLEELRLDLSTLGRLEEAMILGRELHDTATGEFIGLQGGFLRRCFSKADWAAIHREWRDDDSNLDLERLFVLTNQLREEFMPYFTERHKAIDLPMPQTATKTRTNRAANRAAKSR